MFSRLLPTVLCLGQVFNFAYALPAAKRDITDEWTLRGFHWNCSDDGSICIYGFSIAEEMMGTPQQTPTFCHFMIRGGEHQSAVRSAFLDVPCEELESYRCTGSWSSTGYMVLTVDNVEDNTRAYFGFKDDELNDGQFSDIRRSPAYSVVPSAPSAIVMPSEILPRDDGGGDASVGSDDTSYSVVVTEDADGNLILQEVSTADQLADAGNNDAASELMQAGIETPIDGNDLADVLNISPGIDGPTVDALATEVEDVNGPVLPTGVQGDNSSSKADDEPLAGTPPDVPVDAPSATADSLPNTASEQPTSPLSSENAKVADAQSGSELLGNVTNSLSSGPANGSGKSSGKTYLPAVPGTPATWGLRNITRDLSYGPNAVTMSFLIDVLPTGTVPIPCHLHVPVSDNVEPMFYLSWGYNEMTDSAVVTLINPDRDQEAWFGWDFVNSQLPDPSLNNTGPGIVQTCVC